jgi:hypothetical protein
MWDAPEGLSDIMISRDISSTISGKWIARIRAMFAILLGLIFLDKATYAQHLGPSRSDRDKVPPLKPNTFSIEQLHGMARKFTLRTSAPNVTLRIQV